MIPIIEKNDFLIIYDGGAPGNNRGDIAVKKGNVRDFIMLCINVACSVSLEEKKFLYMKALKDGVFEAKYKVFQHDGPEDQDHDVSLSLSLAQSSEPGICELVRKIAKYQTDKKSFWILKNDGIVAARTDQYGDRSRLGYSMKLREVGEDGEHSYDLVYDQIDGDIRRSAFTDAFLDAIEEYMDKRKIDWSNLPLRLCDYCGSPFFGNRYDQRFCKTLHGQRWHAERSNAKKKESAQ